MSEEFFVDGRGIGLEFLRKGMRKHIGTDVVIEPSSYNVSCFDKPLTFSTEAFQGIDGYTLSATRPQTLVSQSLNSSFYVSH